MKLSNLKLLRLQLGLSQTEVADAIGIDQTYLSKLENGAAVFTGELMQKLSKYYDVSQTDLI